MSRPAVSSESFSWIALPLMRQARDLSLADYPRRFRALFGASPAVCSVVWSLASRSLPPKARPIHLLWALLFLKVYATEHANASLAGVDEKTFRKWAWALLESISNLDVVSCFALVFLSFLMQARAFAIAKL